MDCPLSAPRAAGPHGRGTYPTVTYSKAQQAARDAQTLLSAGRDPMEVRNAKQRPASVTFEAATEEFIKAHEAGWSSPKHSHQVRASLETYAYPMLGKRMVGTITPNDVVKALDPIWTTKHETATRARSRIEAVLDWSKAAEYRSGDNPAAWTGNLQYRLPPTARVAKVEHHVALPWPDAPKVYARLASINTTASKLLRFIALTGVRYNEAAGARQSEFDLDADVPIWTVPSSRAKTRQAHRVPLSPAAVAIIRSLWRSGAKGWRLLFVGNTPGKPVSDTRLRTLLREHSGDVIVGADTHGLRSTLRDWAAETTTYPPMVAEAAIEHSLGTKTQTSYLRTDFFDQRVGLMADWSDYLMGTRSG